MPYSNPHQAMAVFLSIKREKGLGAAKAWAKKHHGEMSAAMKGNHNASGGKKKKPPYKPRSQRNG